MMLYNVYNMSNEFIGEVKADSAVEAWEKARKLFDSVYDVRQAKPSNQEPFTLYHGTPTHNIDDILKHGLHPTPFVYLARETDTALEQAIDASFERGEVGIKEYTILAISEVKKEDLVSEELAWEMDEDIAIDKPVLPDRITIIKRVEA